MAKFSRGSPRIEAELYDAEFANSVSIDTDIVCQSGRPRPPTPPSGRRLHLGITCRLRFAIPRPLPSESAMTACAAKTALESTGRMDRGATSSMPTSFPLRSSLLDGRSVEFRQVMTTNLRDKPGDLLVHQVSAINLNIVIAAFSDDAPTMVG